MLLDDVRPLAPNLPFGVRIGGLTTKILEDAAVRKEIDDLFIEHGMIVFEGVENSDEMQLALSSCFGPLKEHPVKAVSRVDSDRMPGVVQIAARPDNGGVVEIAGKQLTHWLPWHFDHCYNDELNRAGVLRAMTIVDEGGITGFMDGIALYKLFPKDLLARIEGKDIVYTLATNYSELKFALPEGYREVKPKPFTQEFNDQANSMRRSIHPAVWTRPTGEKCLHVSQYMAQGILGDETPEGDTLLEEVCNAIIELEPSCSYHHKWKPTDMLIWDNTRMLHAVSGSNPQDTRVMYRTTIKGCYGHGRWDVRTKGRRHSRRRLIARGLGRQLAVRPAVCRTKLTRLAYRATQHGLRRAVQKLLFKRVELFDDVSGHDLENLLIGGLVGQNPFGNQIEIPFARAINALALVVDAEPPEGLIDVGALVVEKQVADILLRKGRMRGLEVLAKFRVTDALLALQQPNYLEHGFVHPLVKTRHGPPTKRASQFIKE